MKRDRLLIIYAVLLALVLWGLRLEGHVHAEFAAHVDHAAHHRAGAVIRLQDLFPLISRLRASCSVSLP